MSRTRHAERKRRAGIGRDYWSRRYPSMVMPWGAYGKRRTHRYERHIGKRMEREEWRALLDRCLTQAPQNEPKT